MRTTILTTCLVLALVGASAGQVSTNPGVLINEVNAAASQWVEIANYSGVPVDISGWKLEIYHDNPADAAPDATHTFPGNPAMPFALGNTILLPDNPMVPGEGFCVVSTIGTGPAVPAGSLFFQFSVANLGGLFAGIPYSVALYDANGDGVDYAAISNANAFDAGLMDAGNANATTPTDWAGHPAGTNPAIGGGVPLFGGVSGVQGGANDAQTYRHSRVDHDDALDWTNDITSITPGAYNPGQTPLAGTTGALPTAAFKANTTCGPAPLPVQLTNISTAEHEMDPRSGAGATMVMWDFDNANPGTQTSTDYHAFHSFMATQDTVLSMVDEIGNAASSMPMTIQAIPGAGLVARTGCQLENFEGFPPDVMDPCGGGTIPDPAAGAEFRGGGRFRIVDQNTIAVGWAFPQATAQSGPTVLLLDSPNGLQVSQFILHVDTTSLPPNGEFTLSYWILENADESHTHDYVAVSDGLTPGDQANAITGGNSTGVPGLDGFHEELIHNWNIGTLGGQVGGGTIRTWSQHTFTFDAAWFAAHPLVIQNAPDLRIIFSQEDNVTFEGNDGLAVDQIEILPTSPFATPMQPADSTAAAMDINFAMNDNCQFVASNGGGPYRAQATFGGQMDLTFQGEPNQPILFLTDTNGNVTDDVLVDPNFGEMNVGTFTGLPPFQVADVALLADGTQTDFLNALFVTDGTGQVSFNLPVNLPPGTYGFQAILFNSATIIRFSNAVELTVN